MTEKLTQQLYQRSSFEKRQTADSGQVTVYMNYDFLNNSSAIDKGKNA